MAASQHVVIVGAGFSGIGMGIRLKEAGIDDFIILEQADEVGGNWRDNHYPGAACDVPSHLYSYSFEPWPEWTRDFAPQPEILQYLKHCVAKYGLTPHLRLRSGARRAEFDQLAGLWTIETTDDKTLTARVMISGCGPLTNPALPDIPGLHSFEGKTFHSARWDHAHSLTGKRVAVIGTGASAIQIVPVVAPKTERLFVFQRSAPWILPKRDAPISPRTRALYRRAPSLQKLRHRIMYWQREVLAVAMVYRPGLLKLAERLALRNLARNVGDENLRKKLVPDYNMGCKRVLPTNDWYPALQRDNVELVTDGIAEIRPHGIVTRDGKERAIDALVLATGFHAAEQRPPFEVIGRDGRALSDAWREGGEAYLGTSIAGFPNLFFLVGPNTGLGHTSMVVMIEAQLAYVLDSIRTLHTRALKSVEVRAEAQKSYNALIQNRLKKTIWSSGCMSWYLTQSGKNTTLWPGFTFEFRYRTRRFDERNYELVAASKDDLRSPTETRHPRVRARASQIGHSGAGE